MDSCTLSWISVAHLLGFGFYVIFFFLLEVVFLFIEGMEGLLSMNSWLLDQDSQFRLTRGRAGREKE